MSVGTIPIAPPPPFCDKCRTQLLEPNPITKLCCMCPLVRYCSDGCRDADAARHSPECLEYRKPAYEWKCQYQWCTSPVVKARKDFCDTACPTCDTARGADAPEPTDYAVLFRRVFGRALIVWSLPVAGLLPELYPLIVDYAEAAQQTELGLFDFGFRSSINHSVRLQRESERVKNGAGSRMYWYSASYNQRSYFGTEFKWNRIGSLPLAQIAVCDRNVISIAAPDETSGGHPIIRVKLAHEFVYAKSRIEELTAYQCNTEYRTKFLTQTGSGVWLEGITGSEWYTKVAFELPGVNGGYYRVPIPQPKKIPAYAYGDAGCFAGGYVLVPADADADANTTRWCDLLSLRVGDRVCCATLTPPADDASNASNATELKYSIHRIAEVLTAHTPASKIVAIACDAALTCGHPVFAETKTGGGRKWIRAADFRGSNTRPAAATAGVCGVVNFVIDTSAASDLNPNIILRTASASAPLICSVFGSHSPHASIRFT